jgi:hypothetical protein
MASGEGLEQGPELGEGGLSLVIADLHRLFSLAIA